MFTPRVTLENDRVKVRPLLVADFDDLYAVAKDPKIWEGHPSGIDRWQLEAFKKFFDAGIDSGGAMAIIDKSNNAIIGSSRYDNLVEDISVEIGWTFLSRAYWGGAFNASFKKLMIDHAFKSVQHVVFQIHIENFRSQRATEKLGGVRSTPDAQPPSLRAKTEKHYAYVIQKD